MTLKHMAIQCHLQCT